MATGDLTYAFSYAFLRLSLALSRAAESIREIGLELALMDALEGAYEPAVIVDFEKANGVPCADIERFEEAMGVSMP